MPVSRPLLSIGGSVARLAWYYFHGSGIRLPLLLQGSCDARAVNFYKEPDSTASSVLELVRLGYGFVAVTVFFVVVLFVRHCL